jgi:hypothetical protein
VKDIDVYIFYSAMPGVLITPRRHRTADFGESEFGHWSFEKPIRGQLFVGRRVDLLQRSLKVPPGSDPVKAVRNWLSGPGETPKRLRQKAVVGIWPDQYLGHIIWPAAKE